MKKNTEATTLKYKTIWSMEGKHVKNGDKSISLARYTKDVNICLSSISRYISELAGKTLSLKVNPNINRTQGG